MHKNVVILRWFSFFTDFRFYAPVAILYFAQVSGSFALGMSVFSLTMLASAALEIPTGIFSDRIGRKRTMVCGSLAATAAVVFYGIGGSFVFLVVGAMLEGLSRAFYSGNNDALLHDSLRIEKKEHTYGEMLGKVSSFAQIALATSAIIGALLAFLSFSTVVWLSVIPQVLCIILSLLLVDVYKTTTTGNVYSHLRYAIALFWKNPKLRLLSLSDMLNFSFSESTYLFQSAFYQLVWPVWAIGIAKALAHAGVAFGFHYSGKILKRFNPFGVLIWGYLFRRSVTILAGIFPTVLSPILMLSSSVPWAVSYTAQNALLQQEFDSSKRATMASLNSFGGSILFALFATGIGLAADILSPEAAIVGIQVASLVNLVLYWRLFKRRAH